MANSLKVLQENGQSVWVDFVARNFLDHRGLARLVQEDGVRGVTSNPSIFEKTIAQSSDYDDALCAVSGNGDVSAYSVYVKLAIEDIRQAADALQEVYETDGADGYVSLEVSPYLANRADATLEEARRLWFDVARANLMIKVPATAAGITAIRQLVAEGINVNATRYKRLFANTALEQTCGQGADPQLKAFEGYVMDSGEGRWTVNAAIEEAVPAPVLSAALYARFASRAQPSFANKMLSAMRKGFSGHQEPKGS